MKENNIKLIVKEQNYNEIDINIIHNDEIAGEVDITLNEYNLYIRHITVKDNFRRKGIAKHVIDMLLIYYRMPITLCVSIGSASAVKFWSSVFVTHKTTNIRGNIYQIELQK